ncbi:MAG: M48 family metallopeptidase [Candidatus Omnitrophica bacterium]|nr:M48 family metallopeptidase [Candidatus Omnitrophota bacterium]
MPEDSPLLNKAKRYSVLKYSLTILDTAYLLALLLIFSGSGLSKALSAIILKFTTNNFIIIPLYFFVLLLAYYILSLPLNFYHSYILERRFALSNQKIGDWLIDQAKSAAISYIIGLILLGVFYYIIERSSHAWWLIISLFWVFFSLILARLVPIIIIPLFFKYKKLSDELLRERIINLAEKMQLKILDVFEIDFSKKTLKANAAFVGWGATKRVILADTLKDKYSYDEIEVILAHEFAHYRLKHLLKLILVNSLATILVFYLIFRTSNLVLALFGFSSLSDIASLPVILLYFVIFGIIMQPLEAYISRRLEKNADMMAIRVTGLKDAFISTMEKLGEQNLADKNPHPIIKFFFFDHPPINERISTARSDF